MVLSYAFIRMFLGICMLGERERGSNQRYSLERTQAYDARSNLEGKIIGEYFYFIFFIPGETTHALGLQMSKILECSDLLSFLANSNSS